MVDIQNELPTLRWGIVATGLISSWFVQDLVMERKDPKAKHVIQAIGSSSVEKGTVFAEKHLAGSGHAPSVYGSYDAVYQDPAVDIVYIGTPHALHKQNCLDAIAAGKHVLCKKPFTLNAAQVGEVFAAARARGGVFVMEAMWTRFFPLVRTLRSLVHGDERAIGDVQRVLCDFSMDQNPGSLGPASRLKDPALGAGSLLDISIYSLTWALLMLEDPAAADADAARRRPKVAALQTLADGIDTASSAILLYPDGRQGIVTSSSAIKKGKQPFCTVQGTRGYVEVQGFTSAPGFFTVHTFDAEGGGLLSRRYDFERPGRGFYWEADAVAQDISAGRVESSVMPWAETVRVMELLDTIRKQGGARFPQDSE
ncbi:hypothetical protein GGTG_12987 [Gaeumannomyces tritici R3-111a-1]|uniref:D-xylose 1-dehydrogenase (NADP(+), D-xylono-1,5-lactone-forming) n=1 Tax=Gaeumannomyces tritici (strain R3-111a-1) TaxID=644352 RepID=J3PHK7_GAET3|nr:hypothetical protein GGTG_12987 [Gaeumannomyces tritici R3-111a-1]EJT69368.1 hypothetical protein GGTG_12987 [Gaeumannomyces tritici R3-111a-1]